MFVTNMYNLQHVFCTERCRFLDPLLVPTGSRRTLFWPNVLDLLIPTTFPRRFPPVPTYLNPPRARCSSQRGTQSRKPIGCIPMKEKVHFQQLQPHSSAPDRLFLDIMTGAPNSSVQARKLASRTPHLPQPIVRDRFWTTITWH